ncbi:hypothetical protein M406DRAFT_105371 [Cryphonectria parasitica EP155]|uniref:DUF2423 domain-containing protein n=1 Tax=Cryphonectria parasitica (strain ATCC 38755 / EP155) TaxID=660469 RepID=A0A9P4YCF9_CRYP1|nr:uncharacterized protein M406DRAFT_105371 [Cryphonectria parasitica EP155]KAF3770444.1 hypothetical protein M406DRAFT_105371 [Cryphonectria parasitica EP155]
MAKSSRASTVKANNQRLKAKVFGPVEDARQERLSAKLLEIASQPKPVPEREMDDAEDKGEAEQKEGTAAEEKADDTAMDVDTAKSQTKSKKGKVVKRRGRKSNIVFPKYGDRKTIRKKR